MTGNSLPQYRLINLTTNIPVDRELELRLQDVLCQGFSLGALTCTASPGIDILFVAPEDPDLDQFVPPCLDDLSPAERDGNASLPAIDALGVYLRESPYHRPVIKISPEKVMDAATTFQLQHHVEMELPNLYATLLLSVVIHELAHAMMDKHGYASIRSADALRWKEQCEMRQSGRNNATQAVLRQPNYGPDLYKLDFAYVIEESLAQAFVLIQSFTTDENTILIDFMRASPIPYNKGLIWASVNRDPVQLIATMGSWRDHKFRDTKMTMGLLQSRLLTELPARKLATALLRGRPPTMPVNFRADFAAFLDKSWDAERSIGKNDGGLSQPLTDNIFWHLVNNADGTDDCQLRDRHLQQWKATGSRLSGEEYTYWQARSSDPQASPKPREDRESIVRWLKQEGIENFQIGTDNKVQVNGHVNLSDRDLGTIPVKFEVVCGRFDCSANRLESVAWLPEETHGDIFACCNQIESLEGLLDLGIKAIDGELDIHGSTIQRGGLGTVNILKLRGLNLTMEHPEALTIIQKYLGKPDDIFDCQAELIEKHLDQYAIP